MKSAHKTVKKITLVALLFAVLFIGQVFGQSGHPAEGLVSQDSYELRFLGCKRTESSYTRSHNGIFLFIWKGQKATQILAYASPDRTKITPFPSFTIHDPSGWKGRGEWCATGAEWVDIKPGQVLTFTMDMMWVESEMPGYPSLKKADKARFHIASMDGEMISDEFPLPLFPIRDK